MTVTTAIANSGRGFVSSIPIRSLLVPLDLTQIALAFIVLYLAMHLQLMWLRSFTMQTVIWVAGYLGMHLQTVGRDLVRYHGKLYRFALVCTYAHIYLSTSCILWNRRRSILHNLTRLCAFALFLFVLNIVRLEVVFLLPDDPQEWAHVLVTGFSGFLIYLAVVYQVEHPFAWFLTHGPERFLPYQENGKPLEIAFPSL